MAKICLISPGQPSTNPRLVKEADALTEAGHDVSMICGHWARWADATDRELLKSRGWLCTFVGGSPSGNLPRYAWTRFRHSVSRRCLPHTATNETLRRWALTRVTPELIQEASRTPADLYVAHYTGALPAAAAGAKKYNAVFAFDAEDFHPGEQPFGATETVFDRSIDQIERTLLPACKYITASSPGIADAYAARYDIARPQVVLNVFPLSQRPSLFRETSDDGPVKLYWFSQTIGAGRGLEEVVRAIGILGRREVELHLRGNWQHAYQDELYRLAASAGLNPSKIVPHPPAHPDQMVSLAAGYDVGLALEQATSANRDICMTNKIFTYLLAGCAVAATKTRGQQLLIDRLGGSGFSYPSGDHVALAERLEEWVTNRESLASARRHAWECGTGEFNWEKEQENLIKVVEHAIGISHSSGCEIGAGWKDRNDVKQAAEIGK
jgi:glycosyltransferase involved in cell wall biosynthesis